jgi:hypothetical protein
MLELLPEGLVLGDKAARQLGAPTIGLFQSADGALLHGQLDQLSVNISLGRRLAHIVNGARCTSSCSLYQCFCLYAVTPRKFVKDSEQNLAVPSAPIYALVPLIAN